MGKYAETERTCDFCKGIVVVGAPTTSNGKLHRGCGNPSFKRRPVQERVPYPLWATLTIWFFLIGGVFVISQLSARGMVAAYGPAGAYRWGVSRPTGPMYNPITSVDAASRLGWVCDGPSIQPRPKPAPGAMFAVNIWNFIPNYQWGVGCVRSTTQAYHRYIGIPVAVTLGTTVLLAGAVWILGLLRRGKTYRSVTAGRFPRADVDDPAFRLYIGRGTGRLADLGHGAGIARTAPVVLRGDDCSQNIAVFGGTSAGKTFYCLNRIFEQALEQDCGLLVFDVKGDYGNTIRALAARTGRSVTRIGVNGTPCNLLAGLTPESAAGFLKSTMLVINPSKDSAVWTNWAHDLAKANLGVLQNMPGQYSLRGLIEAMFSNSGHRLVGDFIKTHTQDLQNQVASNVAGAADELMRFKSYSDYITVIYPRFSEKVQEDIKAGLTQVLQLFTLPEIDAAFCRDVPNSLTMREVLDGGAFILDLPIAKYGIGVKTIYTFIKLRFFNVVERRRTEPSWNQTRKVMFGCDEYQELISAVDLNFWSMSRVANCIGVVSAQGYESFVAAIGDPVVTRATLQNFRQKIAFRSEDLTTVEYFSKILGQTEVELESTSETISRGRSSTGSTNTTGTSESESIREQLVLNAQMFRRLDRGEAVCLLSIDGAAYDDICTLPPCFVTPVAA